MKNIALLLTNMVLPVMGGMFGVAGPLGLMAFFVARKMVGLGLYTCGVPTVCAAGYWAGHTGDSKNRFLPACLRFCFGVIVPVACMVLFVLHPVGRVAYIYSFYWLIPVIIYICMAFVEYGRLVTIFLTALAGSFIAHAVGSVMYLYLLQLTPGYWFALMPVVMVERLISAVGGSLVYGMVGKLLQLRVRRAENL